MKCPKPTNQQNIIFLKAYQIYIQIKNLKVKINTFEIKNTNQLINSIFTWNSDDFLFIQFLMNGIVQMNELMNK